jgi:hypothetical protein
VQDLSKGKLARSTNPQNALLRLETDSHIPTGICVRMTRVVMPLTMKSRCHPKVHVSGQTTDHRPQTMMEY